MLQLFELSEEMFKINEKLFERKNIFNLTF